VELIRKDDILWKFHIEIKGKRKKSIEISQQNSQVLLRLSLSSLISFVQLAMQK
jgi:hypothetical protein